MILQGLWLPVLIESFMGIIRQIQSWSAMFSGEAFLNLFYVAWWTKMMRGFTTFLNAKYDSNKEYPVKRDS